MSEYQYYEFRAVDRPLDREELAAVRALSSRAEITSTSFVNVYNWGDFRGSPEELVEKYYDAFLYVANWGTRWVLLRLPLRLVDREAIDRYCAGKSPRAVIAGENLILSMHSESLPDGWESGSGWLDEILPLRRDLLDGDFRALYLGWLAVLGGQEAAADEAGGPPVPPGLGELSEPHEALVRFLRIDRDVVAAAVEWSEPLEKTTPSESELSDWIRALPGSDKDEFLLRLLREGDGLAAVELRRRCRQARSYAGPPGVDSAPPARTVAEILRRAEELAEARRLREAEEAARKEAEAERERTRVREERIALVRGREAATWIEVERRIEMKQPREYQGVVETIEDLKALSDRGEAAVDFGDRLRKLRERHGKKRALMALLKEAGLWALSARETASAACGSLDPNDTIQRRHQHQRRHQGPSEENPRKRAIGGGPSEKKRRRTIGGP